MAETRALELSFYDIQPYPLEDINVPVSDTADRQGGYTHIIINP